MIRSALERLVIVCVILRPYAGGAISLDENGDIKFGARTSVNARVGTENTHDGILPVGTGGQTVVGTFPHSDGGNLRQNRLFLELEINHDLDRLVQRGVGPLTLLTALPVKIKGLAYHFTFRGEGESLYDWGPTCYSTATEFRRAAEHTPIFPGSITPPAIDVAGDRQRLRHLGTDRERLFQAYVEAYAGRLFLRLGRQVLSWGETDGFQLLDHINPLDSSFGGFLISLDERRVPLDMALANYYIGDIGPASEIHLEGFAAIDNKVGYVPGSVKGSAWTLPGLGALSNTTLSISEAPARTVENTRGGVQLRFNALDATFGVAHYYTYFDTPAVQVFTPKGGIGNRFPDGLPCADGSGNDCGYLIHAVQTAPKVQVSGVSTTFALPQFYSVFRGEVAYFKDEPAFTQGQLDPFLFYFKQPGRKLVFPRGTTGGRRLSDSINAVVGLDTNQWIRFLNANQTFFISTQFFYKHINHAAGHRVFLADGTLNPDREVLPIPQNVVVVPAIPKSTPLNGVRVEPLFIQQPADQYLQTFFIGTSYHSGVINPSLTVFYDWGGALLYQPAVTFSRDPFRFAIDYSIIDAHSPKGGSGVSLLKDRDNVQFRLEYVI